jgi:hypothetical protein
LNSFIVQFLTRDGCRLCEDALPRAKRAARWARVELLSVDIEGDDVLVGLYGLRIPVVVGSDGTVIAEGSLGSVSELARALRSWKRAQVSRPRLLRRLR